MRYRWLIPATAVAAATSGLLVAAGPAAPALAAGGISQPGPFPVGNLLSYQNSDFEGAAAFTAVTNIDPSNGITDSSATSLHGKDSLQFTAQAAGTTALKLQVGSGPTKITVRPGKTYTLGGWFKLPAAGTGESVTFSLDAYQADGTSLGLSATASLALNPVATWQYVEGSVQVPQAAAYVLDSPLITLSNATKGQVTSMDMLVFEPRRAAQAIGAHGSCSSPCMYAARDWLGSNTAIGPLQSDKEFFSGDLPSSFNQTVCAQIENGTGMTQANWPVCIIAYAGTLSADDQTAQADMNSFLDSVPPGQELYLVWAQEAEGKSFSSEPGCDPAATGAAAFRCEFLRQGTFVHDSSGDGPNIFFAMNSAGSQYGTMTGCPWIPANSTSQPGGADVYLVDFYQYQRVEGTDVNTETLHQANWKNWLSCVSGRNRPIGFGEYGLDESVNPPSGSCTNDPNDAAEAPKAMAADNVYLKQLPTSGQAEMQNQVPVAMWDYWYSNFGGTPDCTVFTSQAAISAWQGIETANGGG